MAAGIPLTYHSPYSPYSRLQVLANNPGFAKDVRLLIGLPDDIIMRIHAALEQRVFLEYGIIAQCLEGVSDLDQDTRSALTAAFFHLPRLYYEITSGDGDFSAALRSAIEKSDVFEELDIAVDAVVDKLSLFAKPSNAHRLQWKAEWLATAVGFPLRSMDFVTDLRPVFDDERSAVKGFVAVTMAVMTTTEGKELTASITEADLKELAVKIEHAGNKLRAAREAIEKEGYLVARTGREQAE